MNRTDEELERLLRMAAAAPGDSPAQMPFGFDTRVIAAHRALQPDGRPLAHFIRRTAIAAVLLAICSTAGAWWQASRQDDAADVFGNAYAIADSVIEKGALE